MEFDQLTSEFVAEVCAGKNNLTPVAYQKKLKYLRTYLQDTGISIEGINPDAMQKFVCYLLNRDTKRHGSRIIKGKLSPWPIKTVLTTTKYFFRWCEKTGKLPANPMEDVKIPKTPAPEPKAISPKTVERLITVAATYGESWSRPRNIMLIYLLRDTGGRRLGLANADVDNLDLERRKLNVIDKGNKSCVLRLSQNTVSAIREWLPVRESLQPCDHKLLTGKHGYGIVPRTINTILANLAERASIVGRSNPHAFRHAFARDMLQNNADLTIVSQLMHHSSITVTAEYYARWADDELQQAHEKYSPGRTLPPPPSGSA